MVLQEDQLMDHKLRTVLSTIVGLTFSFWNGDERNYHPHPPSMYLYSMRPNHNVQSFIMNIGPLFFSEALGWNGFKHSNLSGENGYSGRLWVLWKGDFNSSKLVLKSVLVYITVWRKYGRFTQEARSKFMRSGRRYLTGTWIQEA